MLTSRLRLLLPRGMINVILPNIDLHAQQLISLKRAIFQTMPSVLLLLFGVRAMWIAVATEKMHTDGAMRRTRLLMS